MVLAKLRDQRPCQPITQEHQDRKNHDDDIDVGSCPFEIYRLELCVWLGDGEKKECRQTVRETGLVIP